jgi:hypothetical protein
MKPTVVVYVGDSSVKALAFATPSLDIEYIDLRDGLREMDGNEAARKYSFLKELCPPGNNNEFDKDLNAATIETLLKRHVLWLTVKFPRSEWAKVVSNGNTNLGYAEWISERASISKDDIIVLPEAVKKLQEAK